MSFRKDDQRWMESQGLRISENAIKFLPLPKGEGRGEGERRHIYPEIYFGYHSKQSAIFEHICEPRGRSSRRRGGRAPPSNRIVGLERFKKYCSRFGARIFGFWRGFGEGADLPNPVTESKRSQKSKRPLFLSTYPNGYSIF
jgi:hypothetical protein